MENPEYFGLSLGTFAAHFDVKCLTRRGWGKIIDIGNLGNKELGRPGRMVRSRFALCYDIVIPNSAVHVVRCTRHEPRCRVTIGDDIFLSTKRAPVS
jgi:hypothetical protein